MSALTTDFLTTNLISIAERKRITSSELGVRRIGLTAEETSEVVQAGFPIATEAIKGFLIKIGIAALAGGIFKAITQQFIVTTNVLWNFNWNQTDEEIDQLLERMKLIIVGQVGGTLGNAVGYLICGGIPSAIAFFFNEALALHILKEVGEEAFDELMGNLRVLMNSFTQLATNTFIFNVYKATRKFIKDAAKNPNHWVTIVGKRIFGDKFERAVRSWGEKGSKPWTFANKYEEWLDTFKDPVQREFVEEFLEEAAESCQEALFYVADTLDNFVLNQRLNKEIILGKEVVTSIEPNREVPEEKLIVYGREELARTQIIQALGVAHPILDNRDVGQWVGEPMREEVTRLPPVSIQMRIILNEKAQSPFIKRVRINNQDVLKPSKRVQITIPNVDRSKLDWGRIKAAVGGQNGYMWGRFQGKARLNDGSNLYVQAATQEEVKDRIEALLVFTKNELISLNVLEILKEGNRKRFESLYPQPTRVYPIGFMIINQQKVINEESGIAQLSGVYKSKKDIISLNVDTKPDDFEKRIQELFHIPGPNNPS